MHTCPQCGTPCRCPMCDGPETERLSKADCETLLALWNNAVHPEVPRVRTITRERKRKLLARMRSLDGTVEGLKAWLVEIIAEINKTPFLHGANDRGWTAKFDWIIENENNAAKVLEGAYRSSASGVQQARREAQQKPVAKSPVEMTDRELAEAAKAGNATAARLLRERQARRRSS